MITKKLNLLKIGKKYNNKYNSQSPYPHIVLDNFFNEKLLDDVVNEFDLNTKTKSYLIIQMKKNYLKQME